MKYVIVIIAVVVVLILWMMKSKPTSITNQGTLSDIPRYIGALLESDIPGAFLIITHESSGDFLQFTARENTIQMDFPLITEQQKKKSNKLKVVCSELGLKLEENTGSDGSKFCDWNLRATPEEMSRIITSVFIQTFESKEEDHLIFQYGGLTIK